MANQFKIVVFLVSIILLLITVIAHPDGGDQYNQCLAGCPTTFDYRPLCGSDGETYSNKGGLNCANRCGKSVTMQRAGPC